ncbi:hypothetical protein C6H67_29185, partial [Klebsiella pneumoniae]
ELANTGYLPRIAPARVGADLRWSKDGWRASVGATSTSPCRTATTTTITTWNWPTPATCRVSPRPASVPTCAGRRTAGAPRSV